MKRSWRCDFQFGLSLVLIVATQKSPRLAMEDFSCPLGNKAGGETFIGIFTGFQSSYGVSGNLLSMLVAQRELVTSKHTNKEQWYGYRFTFFLVRLYNHSSLRVKAINLRWNHHTFGKAKTIILVANLHHSLW